MCFSGLAILISIFNMVMCAQNEFDPIVLEAEMLRRREKIQEEGKLKRRQAVESQIEDFRVSMKK